MTEYVQAMWDLAVEGDKQGIWFWAALYTFFVCGYSAVFQLLIRTWPSTKGQLINLGLDKFGSAMVLSDQDYKADALYTYQVNGKSYQGKRLSPWIIIASHNAKFVLKNQLAKVQTYPNNKVEVFYKASNPAKSWLILPSKLGILITMLISLLPALSYWLKFYG